MTSSLSLVVLIALVAFSAAEDNTNTYIECNKAVDALEKVIIKGAGSTGNLLPFLLEIGKAVDLALDKCRIMIRDSDLEIEKQGASACEYALGTPAMAYLGWTLNEVGWGDRELIDGQIASVLYSSIMYVRAHCDPSSSSSIWSKSLPPCEDKCNPLVAKLLQEVKVLFYDTKSFSSIITAGEKVNLRVQELERCSSSKKN